MVSVAVSDIRKSWITATLLLGYKFYERPRRRGDPYRYELTFPNGLYSPRAFKFKWEAACYALEREGVDPKSFKS